MGVGDSITFGMGVPQGERFLNRLEDSLNRSRGGHTFEVMNFGINGYSAAEVLALVKEYAPVFTPDLLIYTVVRNDILPAPGRVENSSQTKPATGRLVQRLWRDSYVLLFARPRVRSLLHRFGIRTGLSAFDIYQKAYEDGSDEWGRLANYLDRIHALSTELGALFVIAIYAEYEGDELVLPGYVQQLQSHCRKRGIRCVNLFEAARGHDRPVLRIHPFDGHPNGFFNGLMADYLVQALSDVRILPAAGNGS